MRLKEVPRLREEELRALISEGQTFVLYVRSEKDAGKIREILDIDVVFPELARDFGDSVSFFWCDIDEIKELSELKVKTGKLS